MTLCISAQSIHSIIGATLNLCANMLMLFRFIVTPETVDIHRSLGPPCCFAFAFGCGELLFRCFETKNQSLATMSFDESKAEVAEAEDDDLGDRLRKQFEDGLITEEEMNKNLQA